MAVKHFCDVCGEETPAPPNPPKTGPWLTLPTKNGIVVNISVATTDTKGVTQLICAKCILGTVEKYLLERQLGLGGGR